MSTKPTDVAVLVTSFDGGPHDLFSPETCATNGLVHASLTAVLAVGAAPS